MFYIVEINTTAYKEENFYALTNIERKNLINCINDFVQEKRKNEDDDYTNEDIENYVKNHFSLCEKNYFEIRFIEYIAI